MNKKRLLKLADFLESIPRKAFEIRWWVARDATKPEGETPGDCGFAGCAVGWAAHTRMFRGLRLLGTCPVYEHEFGFKAVDRLFGFEPPAEYPGNGSPAANHLFSGKHYAKPPTPKQVAARIRKFVKDTSSSSEA